MNKENISKYIDYALGLIEENPETLEKAIQQNNIDVGVPNYVANLISKIDGIAGEDAIATAVSILSTIDKMILESGIEYSKEQRMALISKTIQRVLEVNPQLAEDVQAMAAELDQGSEEVTEEPIEEEEGVF